MPLADDLLEELRQLRDEQRRSNERLDRLLAGIDRAFEMNKRLADSVLVEAKAKTNLAEPIKQVVYRLDGYGVQMSALSEQLRLGQALASAETHVVAEKVDRLDEKTGPHALVDEDGSGKHDRIGMVASVIRALDRSGTATKLLVFAILLAALLGGYVPHLVKALTPQGVTP